jgi:hypothetical protein
MSTERVYQGGRPGTQGRDNDPLVTVSLHVLKSQLAELDQLADAERGLYHHSRAGMPVSRRTRRPRDVLTGRLDRNEC